jgi:MFS family permease
MGVSAEVVVNTNYEKKTNKAYLVVIGLLCLLGLGFWIKQFTSGFSGYSAQYAWGLYIAAFFTAVAGGAGAMILGSVAMVMDLIDKKKSEQYYVAAIAMFVAAGFFILADLGSPLNVLKLVFTSNIAAPMVLDFWLLIACLLICILVFFSNNQKKSLSVVGLLCAFALLLVESWLISSANVQQLWSLTMGAGPAFIQVAIMALALLMLIGQEPKFVKFALILTLIAFLAVSLTDLIAGFSNNGRLGLQWTALSKSGLFWSGIVLGTIVPILMLLASIKVDKFSSSIISILAMLGVLLTKLSYLWGSQAVPAIVSGKLSSAGLHYEEVIIVAGFTALGILVYYGLNACKGGSEL